MSEHKCTEHPDIDSVETMHRNGANVHMCNECRIKYNYWMLRDGVGTDEAVLRALSVIPLEKIRDLVQELKGRKIG